MIKYLIITLLLLVLEMVYFKLAERFNIIDRPNGRSSHSSVTLRGGGVIFLIGAWLFSAFYGFAYPRFLAGLTLISLVSFVDDVRSLPDSIRLIVQFIAAVLLFYELGIIHWDMWWIVILSLVVCVGITNVYNFMDGINGITGGYSLAVLVPLLLLNKENLYVDTSLIVVTILSVLVFCVFNFRPRGRAKCFAGDVGSISIAFIILFILGSIIFKTGDLTYLMLLVVYGVDACLTILHRIKLHENLGEAHRKHVYQLMANELSIGHTKVSGIYMALQLAVSLTFIYFIPETQAAHWVYLCSVVTLLIMAYVIFMKKNYHLHEEYLNSLRK